MSPTWGLSGVINLPYAEIEEPFEAWYNLTGNKSRIQYYGGKQAGVHRGPMQREDAGRTTVPQFPLPAGTGQVITYQLGGVKPYGMQYKITPETTEKKVNTRTCFQLPGSKQDVVKAQSVFPSMDGFKVRNARASSGGGAGQLQTGGVGCWDRPGRVPAHPGAQGGSFPRPDRGWSAGSFPNPSSRVGTCCSPQECRCFGTARASRCTAAQLPLAPGSGRALCHA